jgi:hypothetical protein
MLKNKLINLSSAATIVIYFFYIYKIYIITENNLKTKRNILYTS